MHILMIEFNADIFGPPSNALVDYHLEKGGMLLHDAVGVIYIRSTITENQVRGAWYIG